MFDEYFDIGDDKKWGLSINKASNNQSIDSKDDTIEVKIG